MCMFCPSRLRARRHSCAGRRHASGQQHLGPARRASEPGLNGGAMAYIKRPPNHRLRPAGAQSRHRRGRPLPGRRRPGDSPHARSVVDGARDCRANAWPTPSSARPHCSKPSCGPTRTRRRPQARVPSGGFYPLLPRLLDIPVIDLPSLLRSLETDVQQWTLRLTDDIGLIAITPHDGP